MRVKSSARVTVNSPSLTMSTVKDSFENCSRLRECAISLSMTNCQTKPRLACNLSVRTQSSQSYLAPPIVQQDCRHALPNKSRGGAIQAGEFQRQTCAWRMMPPTYRLQELSVLLVPYSHRAA